MQTTNNFSPLNFKVNLIKDNPYRDYTLCCKDTKVLDLDTFECFHQGLLPGYLLMNGYNKDAFKSWMKLRYDSGSNTIARTLLGTSFKQNGRTQANLMTLSLSLSDCYWLKPKEKDLKFKEVSPYYQDFYKGEKEYTDLSIPTIYTQGFLNKEWTDESTLVKYYPDKETADKEFKAISFCKTIGVPVNEVIKITDTSLAFTNLTGPDVMLESAEMSGIFTEQNESDEFIYEVFGFKGLRMQVIDALLGNPDRHKGNYAFYRFTKDGGYNGLSPLYDFDHAYDISSVNNLLVRDAIVQINKSKPEDKIRINNLLNKVISSFNDITSMRAGWILLQIG